VKFRKSILVVVIVAAALFPLPASAQTLSLTTDLVAYWRLDETTGTRVDSVGGNSLASANGVSYELDPPDGNALIVSAASFAASSSQYLSTADSNDLSATGFTADSMTFTAWARLDDKSAYRYIISKSATTEYYIDYNPSEDRFRFGWGDSYIFANSLGSPSINTWYFIVGWYDVDTDTINIAVNDGAPDSITPPGFNPSGNGDFLVGWQGNLGYYMDGLIDEAGVWRRVLTSEERTQLYNDGAGLSYPFGDVPVQDDLSWIEDGNFDLAIADSPWQYLNGQRYPNGAPGAVVPRANAYCGGSYAQIDPNYEKFYPNAVYGQVVNSNPPPAYVEAVISSDPPVWNSIPSLSQRFYWPGGVGYFQARIMPSVSTGSSVRATIVKVENTYGPPDTWTPISAYVFSGQPTWKLYTATRSLSAGWYDIDFYETSYEDQLVSDFPDPESDGNAPYLVDDVTLSLNSYTTHCAFEGGPTRTPFPTSTRTPTPTRTLTPTSGASPTPSATGTPKAATFGNCNFEQGLTGWTGSGASVGTAGGPIGPQYGQTTSTLYQTFNWSGGYAFFTYWVGPGSNGSVRVRNTSSQGYTTLSTHASPSTWQLKTAATNLVAGNYALEAIASSGLMKLDGVMVAANSYYYCGGGNSAVTPTTGPTSYVTLTPTRTPQYTNTPTSTPTSTSSRTPFATSTAQPTSTPRPTNTQPPTSTSAPTNTQESAQQTATAQGTEVPTFTPYPTFTSLPTYTPYPTATPYDAPPEQPEPNFYADCLRPQNADPGAWTEYSTCYALSWFAWSDINSREITDFVDGAGEKEPFGTIREVGEAVGDFRTLWAGYDWSDTGLLAGDEEADTGTFSQPASGILLGQLDLNNTTHTYSLACNLRLDDVLGPNVTVAVCFVWGMLRAVGFLTWLQLLWDVLMVWLLIRYIQKAWVSKATNG
jgi:hypothetical protein